jgi:hypothetical protein
MRSRLPEQPSDTLVSLAGGAPAGIDRRRYSYPGSEVRAPHQSASSRLEPVVFLSPIRSSDPGCRGEDLIKPGA